jgi:hypothetical protein
VIDALDRLDPETGLPRAAILVVRHLEGAVAGSPARVIGVDLRETARRAHRAAAGPPSRDCDAVLFADEADLLASLAADLAAGRPLGWWWRVLLFGGTRESPGATPAIAPAVALAAVFTRFARALPAAATLAYSSIRDAAALLAPAEVVRILGLMADAHAAPALVDIARRAASTFAAGAAADVVAHVGQRDEIPRHSVHPVGRTAGLGAAAGDRTRTSGDARSVLAALLTATAAQLHRDPVGARTATRAEEVAQVIAAALNPLAALPPARANGPTTTGSATGPESPAEAGEVAEANVSSPPATGSGPDAELSVGDDAGLTIDDRPSAPRSLRTGLGGAFYLLNVLEWLDLPASAHGAGEPGPTMNRWGVLAGALAALVGGRDAPAWPGVDLTDPLFELLDELSGPSHHDLVSPWAYRCPPAALASLGSTGEPWRWWSTGERLVLERGAIVIADVPLNEHDGASPDPGVVAREQAMAVLAGAPTTPEVPGDPAIAHEHVAGSWYERVDELLCALLARAQLEPSVVHVPATVELTESTIRVRMRLDDVDLGVRRAGLDRNPGWVPELGRLVDLEFA